MNLMLQDEYQTDRLTAGGVLLSLRKSPQDRGSHAPLAAATSQALSPHTDAGLCRFLPHQASTRRYHGVKSTPDNYAWKHFLFQVLSSSLFVGTRCGSLYCVDELGHSPAVQTFGARIDHMLFFEAKLRLIIITRALVLVQLQISSDYKIIPITKMKVAIAGGAVERGIKNICWVGPGIIAAATGEVCSSEHMAE